LQIRRRPAAAQRQPLELGAPFVLHLRCRATMSRNRLEAFSDGVIAILITIMVLELKVPHGGDWDALFERRHEFSAYVLSFVYLGIYWNNHHHMLHTVTRVTGSMLWANLHLLFWLSLVPFTTAWVGENETSSPPAVVYGVVLVCSAIAWTILQTRIVRVLGPDSTLARAVGRDNKGKASIACYVLGIAAYVAVALMWLIPDRRVERTLSGPHEDRGRIPP